MDNHTEFMDVAAGFARMLRDRSAACPPSSMLTGWEPLLGLAPPSSRPASQPAPAHNASPHKQRPLPGFMQATKRVTSRNMSRRSLTGSKASRSSNTGSKRGTETNNTCGAEPEPEPEPVVERSRSPLHMVDAATMLFGGDRVQPGEGGMVGASLNLDTGFLSAEETVALLCALVEDR